MLLQSPAATPERPRVSFFNAQKKKKTEERIQCVKVRAATAVCPSLPDFPKQAGQAMACGLRAPAGTSLAASMPGCRAVIPLPTALQLWGPEGSWFLEFITPPPHPPAKGYGGDMMQKRGIAFPDDGSLVEFQELILWC